ncbi:CsbD family protein [Caenimonas koreensis]|uniref:CsbD family protein n=1 Tax=Caenimonas koreensis DSM 17982 TaxID=1121255 RepID=A0A844AY58_9BURK|nr:CsbD family protein [Caenimonas koreensis]MRD46002.1 CsbD family protein [Caenimonas koreensis DSM 17982]
MNHDTIEGSWKQLKGKVKEQWGKLTEDDMDVIAGKRDQLLGRIQHRHGLAKDEAERQVEKFERRNPEYQFKRNKDFPFEKS